MSFVDNLRTEANYKQTMNGALTHGTTGDACLDLFAIAGGMRGKSARELTDLFTYAYIENPELAMKLLFYIRDIREGLGERQIFRTLIRHVAKRWPESAKKNVALVSEYGRFDDFLCLLGTPSQDEVIRVIREQLDKDLSALEARKAGDTGAHISLLAKWMPSINTSSARTRAQAKMLAEALDMSAGEYRKMLSALRANIGLVEVYLTSSSVDKVNYEAVPAGALYKYRGAFERQDRKRFDEYLLEASNGDKKIHCDTLYPYEIIRPLFPIPYSLYRTNWNTPAGVAALEAMWNNMSAPVGNANSISVIDTSGSMYCGRKGAPLPALVSQSLGLYYAEHCTGTFHNMFITFESEPHLIEIHGKNLIDKLEYIQNADWEGSTNLEAVFDLILRTAVNAGTPQEELPSTLYIISDMEFNCAVSNPDMTIYENAKAKFEAAGYQLPAVVFHNVNSWQVQAPVQAHTKGTALSSGAGTNSFKHEFDGNITPYEHMLRVLNGPRYAAVHA